MSDISNGGPMNHDAFRDAVVRLYAAAVLDGLRALAQFDLEGAAYHMAKASLLAQAAAKS